VNTTPKEAAMSGGTEPKEAFIDIESLTVGETMAKVAELEAAGFTVFIRMGTHQITDVTTDPTDT
jgi:hypothetical protein